MGVMDIRDQKSVSSRSILIIDAIAIAVKTLGYISMAVALGSVLCLTVLRQLPKAERHFLPWLTFIAASIALITIVGRIGIEVIFLAEGDVAALFDGELIGFILSGPLAQTFFIQFSGLLLTGASIFIPVVGLPLALIGVLAVSASFGLSGHVGSYEGLWLSVLITLHWLALGFWAGIFIPLYRVCGYDAQSAAKIAHEFGRLAVGFVGILVIAGATTLYQLTDGRLLDLNDGYTQLFAIKLSVFLLVLALAAVNKLSLTPALNRGDRLAPGRMKQSLLLEGMLIIVVMVVSASIITLTSPAG